METEISVLAIKNMVCPRCIKAVNEGLKNLNCEVIEVSLGLAKIKGSIDKRLVRDMLLANGFELLDSKEQKLVEGVKTTIISLVQSQGMAINQNLSAWLAKQLNADYHLLSTLFSEAEGMTIERYFILQRIEKVKELLVYKELSLKEIAYQIGFSSVPHLSTQFKKITGFTTTHFREIGQHKRKSLDQINS